MRRHLAFAVLMGLTACTHHVPPPSHVAESTAARAVGVYRAIAESIYVGSTKRVVAVSTASLDSACTSVRCDALAARWGVETLWWATGDSSEARDARNDLLARAAPPFDVGAVAVGRVMLLEADPGDVTPAGRRHVRVGALSRRACGRLWRRAHVACGIQPAGAHGGGVRGLALRPYLRPHVGRGASGHQRFHMVGGRNASAIVASKVGRALIALPAGGFLVLRQIVV